MIERFERLADELLAKAEGSTPETKNSAWEKRALLANAAAQCAMAAVALGQVSFDLASFVLTPDLCTDGVPHEYDSESFKCVRCGKEAPVKGVQIDEKPQRS